MKNLAQQLEIETKEHRASLDSQLDSHRLHLHGDQPVNVYMQPYTTPDNKTRASFGLSSTGTFYTGGLSWKCGAEYSLFVNFLFQPNGNTTITSIDCDASIPLLYTPVADSVQSCAVPPVRGTYRFYVNFSTGEKHDPQIVVTPQ